MKKIYRWLMLLILLFAAISAYSYGSRVGVFAIIIVGFVLEGIFWLTLFKNKKS